MAGGLHRAESWEQVLAETRKVSALVGELEGRYLIFLPEMYRDIADGRHLESAQLDADQWQNLVRGVTRLGKIVREGMQTCSQSSSRISTRVIRSFRCRSRSGPVTT